MSGLRHTPLHRALHRPNLILGGERELVLLSGLVAGGLIVSALNLAATLVGLAVWLIALSVLRMMAAADPHLSQVYGRQLKYSLYYAPRARAFRRE